MNFILKMAVCMSRFFLFFLTFCIAATNFAYSATTSHQVRKNQDTGPQKNNVVLYIKPNCPYCLSVLRTLDSLNKKIPIKDISAHPEFGKELIQIGGRRQVPCMVINGKALYESREITHWLQNNVGTY